MNLCDLKHDEICYEGRDCPLCAEKEDLENKLEEARERIKELEDME